MSLKLKSALYALYDALAQDFPHEASDATAQQLVAQANFLMTATIEPPCVEPIAKALAVMQESVGKWYWDADYDIEQQTALFQDLLDSTGTQCLQSAPLPVPSPIRAERHSPQPIQPEWD